MKRVAKLLFLFFINTSLLSQQGNAYKNESVELKKIEKIVNTQWGNSNEWYYAEESDSWSVIDENIFFNIQLYNYGNRSIDKRKLWLSIIDLQGMTYTQQCFSVDSSYKSTGFLKIPKDCKTGPYMILAFIRVNNEDNKIFEKYFFLNAFDRKLSFISRNQSYCEDHFLEFFPGSDDFKGNIPDQIGIITKSGENNPISVGGLILNKRYDTLCTILTNTNGVEVISNPAKNFDSILIRISWPTGVEVDYDIPAEWKEGAILLQVFFERGILNYKIWSTKSYSANIGLLLLVGIINNQVFYSKALNQNGKLALYSDSIPAKLLSSGAIKLNIFQKDGKKIAERVFGFHKDNKYVILK